MFKKITLIILCGWSLCLPVNAQDTAQAQEIDIVDVVTDNKVYKGLFGTPKPRIESYKPQAALLPAAGYTMQTGFAVVLAGNVQFYSVPDDHSKASSLNASVTYTQKNQLILPLYINLWMKGNKINLLSDNRYMNYPSQNYGIGPKSKEANGYTIVYSYIKLHEILSFKIRKNTYLGLGYFYDYFWNIKELDVQPSPAGSGNVSLLGRYGKKNKELSSGLVIKPFYDSRANQVNPTKGALAALTCRLNTTALGSDGSWFSLISDVRKYIPFPRSSKNTIALWSYNWITVGRTPYLLLPSTGWDDQFNIGRGYIQGRFKDRNMAYLEAEYRFRLLRNGLLGGVVFGNVQSYTRNVTNNNRMIIPGYGTGIRIKLNKFASTNLAIDYAFGLDGSKGFFVNLGEVF